MTKFEIAYDYMKYSGVKCRKEAETLTTRAEIYEQCADKLLQAIEKEQAEDKAKCS